MLVSGQGVGPDRDPEGEEIMSKTLWTVTDTMTDATFTGSWTEVINTIRDWNADAPAEFFESVDALEAEFRAGSPSDGILTALAVDIKAVR